MNDIINKIKKIGVKKIIIFIAILIAVIIFISLINLFIEKSVLKKKVLENNYTSITDFKSVREVALYMGCEYINEKQIKDSEYYEEIYLKFNKNLFSPEGNSNEGFFQKLSIYIANVLDFSSFVMIDESTNTTIEVVCDKTERIVKNMKINGNSNYYLDEESKKNLDNYKDVKDNNIIVNSEILKTLIANGWNERITDFGTKETTFDDYDIYFDEGIEVKRIGDKVFNIIFTDKYNKKIVNDIMVGENFEKIKKYLGEPQFNSANIIGYKSDEIYVFFEKDEISIYRVENSKNEDFVKIEQQLKNGENIKKITNNLTDIWGDYDVYEVSENSIRIEYTLRGIKFEYNVSKNQGITLYKNYTGYITENKTISEITEEELPNNLYIDVNYDLVYLKEIQRVEEIQNYMYYDSQSKEGKSEEELKNYSSKFYYYEDNSNELPKIKFVSINKEYPNFEMEANVDSYIWKDDYIYIYSIKQKGIYMLNLKDRKIVTIKEGTENFKLKEYNSGILKYDDKAIKI